MVWSSSCNDIFVSFLVRLGSSSEVKNGNFAWEVLQKLTLGLSENYAPNSAKAKPTWSSKPFGNLSKPKTKTVHENEADFARSGLEFWGRGDTRRDATLGPGVP